MKGGELGADRDREAEWDTGVAGAGEAELPSLRRLPLFLQMGGAGGEDRQSKGAAGLPGLELGQELRGAALANSPSALQLLSESRSHPAARL